MTKLAWWCALLVALAPMDFGRAAEQTAAPEGMSAVSAALLAKENALAAAEKKKDAAAMRQLLADDFMGIGTNGQPFGRGEMLEGFNEVTLEQYTIYGAQVVPINEGAALLTYDAIVRIAGGDSLVPRYQRVSSLWVNQNATWKLKFQQATAMKWGD